MEQRASPLYAEAVRSRCPSNRPPPPTACRALRRSGRRWRLARMLSSLSASNWPLYDRLGIASLAPARGVSSMRASINPPGGACGAVTASRPSTTVTAWPVQARSAAISQCRHEVLGQLLALIPVCPALPPTLSAGLSCGGLNWTAHTFRDLSHEEWAAEYHALRNCRGSRRSNSGYRGPDLLARCDSVPDSVFTRTYDKVAG